MTALPFDGSQPNGKPPRMRELIAVLNGDPAPRSQQDWTRCLEAAERHGVLPCLAQRVLNDAHMEIPDAVRTELLQFSRHHCAHCLFLLAELSTLITLLEDAGIRTITLKGPALSAQLYQDATRRVSFDLDVLVAPEHFRPARNLLLQHGYVPECALSIRQERALLERYHDFAFTSPAGCLIELHWQLIQARYAVAIDVTRLRRRCFTISVGNSRLRVLHPDDQLLFLALHGAKHQWSQLDLVLDIAALVRSGQADLDATRSYAQITGLTDVLELALLLAEHVDTTLRTAQARTGSRLQRLAADIMTRWETGATRDRSGALLFDLRVRERWSDRARLAYHTLVTPGWSDWMALTLPDALFPLYHVIRPFRLLTHRLFQPRQLGR